MACPQQYQKIQTEILAPQGGWVGKSDSSGSYPPPYFRRFIMIRHNQDLTEADQDAARSGIDESWHIRPELDSPLMTEEELIDYLRIPEVSNATDFHNVIENLKRARDLPRIRLCNGVLYPKAAVEKWVSDNITT